MNKAEPLKAGGLLHPLEIPDAKWESISMDFIIGLPTTNRGHDAIWVIVDWLTKLCRFVPTKKLITTPELARLFVENVYRLYGLPSNIVSDRDCKFNGHFWWAVFNKLDTKLNLSTIDHPQIDGQTKRVKCLGHMSARSNLIGSLICLLSSLLTIVQSMSRQALAHSCWCMVFSHVHLCRWGGKWENQ